MFNEIKTHEITVDIVILTIKNNALQVLLVKRSNEPFKGKWAIPGGYVRMSENLAITPSPPIPSVLQRFPFQVPEVLPKSRT